MTFVKGKSGNPGGRPARSPEVVKILKRLGKESLEVIEHLMRNAEDESVRLNAAKYLSDQANGKAKELVEVTGRDGTDLIPVIAVNARSKN